MPTPAFPLEGIPKREGGSASLLASQAPVFRGDRGIAANGSQLKLSHNYARFMSLARTLILVNTFLTAGARIWPRSSHTVCAASIFGNRCRALEAYFFPLADAPRLRFSGLT